MSTIQADSQPERQEAASSPIVNDFSIQVATANGSGSQSSNNVLMRAIFNMGVPVSGKNLFPSNIAGLPTWFTIRVSHQGYVARRAGIEILIAMNPATAIEDVQSLAPGSVVLYEEKLKLDQKRDDLVFYPVPFASLAGEVVKDTRLKKLVANMVYVGAAAELLSIDMEAIQQAIRHWFKAKAKAAEVNVKAADLGAAYVRDNLTKGDPYRVEVLNQTADKIIIDGNSAAALGCVMGGVSVVTWYPITPSSSLGETLTDYLQQHRIDSETGKATFAVVQAEDELAAVGMAIGAGWTGARAMTTTSGPGISLMSEFAGLAYFAEVPVVIFDVQRVGPSTGLPTRTSQGDVLSMYTLSHGDTKHIVLLPGSMAECYEMAIESFNLAEELQQPVFVGSDLDLAMNNWMCDPFEYPTEPLRRGKVLTAEDLERMGEFGRYRDVDGDGIPYRTLPGTEHPLGSYLTRGSGRNDEARYSERPEDFQSQMDRLSRKHETAREMVPAPVIRRVEGAASGVIAYGSSDPAVCEALDQLSREAETDLSYLRVRALPFNSSVREFLQAHDTVYVVEQNRDGQLADLLVVEYPELGGRIRKIRHYNGLPIDARFISNQLLAEIRPDASPKD